MTELHPIFADCVCTESSRYCINAPFRCKQWIAATDGRICVWVRDKSSAFPVEPNKRPVDITTLDWKRDNYDELPTPLDDFNPFDCPSCNGTGIDECDTCNGTGTHECSCGDEHRCLDCGGEPNSACSICDKGKHYQTDRVALAGKYFAILRRHGATLYLRRTGEAYPKNGMQSVYFTVGDVEGLLMPCCKEGEHI